MENKTAKRLALGSTFFVTVGAFALSFDAQRKAAVSFGIDDSLAFVIPLVIDVSIVAFSLMGVHASMVDHEELLAYAKKWTKFSIGTTLLFNFSHARSVDAIILGNEFFKALFEVAYTLSAPIFVAALVHSIMVLVGQNNGDAKAEKLQLAFNELKAGNVELQGFVSKLESKIARLEREKGEMQFGYSVWNRLAPHSKKFLTDVLIDETTTNKDYAELFNIKTTAVSNAKKVIVLDGGAK